MELLEAILRRRSIRKFEDKDVTNEQVGELLSALRWAPSAGNRQPWDVIVVEDEELQDELAEIAYEQMWIASAPVIFVICVNERRAKGSYGERGAKLYGPQATGAAMQNMMLRATDMGLGSCWVGAFDENQVSVLLECEDYIRPVGMIPVGYPAEEKEGTPPRQDVSDFAYLDKFGRQEVGEWKGLKKHARKAKREAKKLIDSLRKY